MSGSSRKWSVLACLGCALFLVFVLSPGSAAPLQAVTDRMPQKLPDWVTRFQTSAPPPLVRVEDAQQRLSFRQRVDKATAHKNGARRATLTFDHIYVVSLKARTDRRETMSRLAAALGLRFTFIDAEPKESDLIKWIGERVLLMREQKRKPLAAALGGKDRQVGGMGIGAIWLARPGQRGEVGVLQLPSAKLSQYEGLDWVEFMNKEESRFSDSGETSPFLKPVNASFDIATSLRDPLEKMDSRQINEAVLSTWHSHNKAIKAMRQNNDESALVLEDDVDIEWDIEKMWATIHRRLPSDWRMAYVGHCWGQEMTYPTDLHPALFHSFSPRCLHAYALSRAGYTTLSDLLAEPWSAYQAPIDVAIPSLAAPGFFQTLSIDPPLVIQAKDSPSDIQAGVGSKWRGLLADSTLDRIWRDEGKNVTQLNWDEAIHDPYVSKHKIAGQHYR